MSKVSNILRVYLDGVLRLSGAQGVSLYVPAPLSINGHSEPLLLHVGTLGPLPEFVDLEAAGALASRVGARSAEGGPGEGAWEIYDSAGAGLLVCQPPPVGVLGSRWSDGTETDLAFGRRLSDQEQGGADPDQRVWHGLGFAGDDTPSLEFVREHGLPFVPPPGGLTPTSWQWAFGLGAALSSHAVQVSAILRDPVTELPNRSAFQSILLDQFERARRERQPLALLLVNPDGFAAVNERFGREAGDGIVAEIADRLRSSLRSTDSISRYGGVIFAVTLVDTPLEVAMRLANELRRRVAEGAFLGGAVRLGFSIGVACLAGDEPEGPSHLELLRRADQALNSAKRSGGDSVVDWDEGAGREESGNFDRLSGIFTGNQSKDYRNMVLLSDSLEVIAQQHDFVGLAERIVDRLWLAFQADRVGVFQLGDDKSLRLVAGLTRRSPEDSGIQRRVESVDLDDEERELVDRALEEGEARQGGREAAGARPPDVGYAVPLLLGDERLGCLFVAGQRDTVSLDRSDLIFLRALGAHLTVAFDRARLAESDRQLRERERRELRAELQGLRRAVQQSRLVCRSPEMDELLALARRVAPTEATVLVVGESGTGKELLAKTIHELSGRQGRPLVVVDCGSIASSLIESELFGHERGAFTGAQQRRVGRLAEAAEGTVLLDEIGELPLEVQAKLLRFVQEKQLTSVGGTRSTTVDVRILAATNRDLGAEVEAGRFREDLYHRLNVVRLEVPALRERPSDILHLANHFLELYVVQYQKKLRLTAAAEEALEGYGWPGNVRELQNRMMQAVILSEGATIGPGELRLDGSRSNSGVDNSGSALQPSGQAPSPSHASSSPSVAESWRGLSEALEEEISSAVLGDPRGLPIGRWLRDDLLILVGEAAGRNTRRGAEMIGLAPTTFRRRLRKAERNLSSGFTQRSPTWDRVIRSLRGLVAAMRTAPAGGEDTLKRADGLLLERILEARPSQVQVGAELLGVSIPTYRRRIASRADNDLE